MFWGCWPSCAQELLDHRGAGRRCVTGRDAAAAGLSNWAADGVREDLRAYVVGTWATRARCWWPVRPEMSRRAPHARVAAAVPGTAGRIENAQVGVFLGYAARRRPR